MIVDGKRIAEKLKSELRTNLSNVRKKLVLGVLVVSETPAIRQFVSYKERCGEDIGVQVDVIKTSKSGLKTEDLLHEIIQTSKHRDGLILQLPIPSELDLDSALNLFPLSHDVDVLGNTAFTQYKEGVLPFHPPVVGACSAILKDANVSIAGKKVVVVGTGRLVGGPAAVWAERMGAYVTVANRSTADLGKVTREADVIISGTGVPGLITPEMVREGVTIIDAGSGELAGTVKGDVDELCAKKAALFTPTPGGVGPITVAKVFENLLTLYHARNPQKKIIA